MIYDLHSHSNLSDGILSPEDLVSRAVAKGVTHLALTDHDTLAALPRAANCALLAGLDLIGGIEFSTQWQNRGIHIVGLNVDDANPALLEAVRHQSESRDLRAEAIAGKLERCGFKDALAGARHYAGDGVIGRPHFAQFLVAQGHVANANQAFKQYLGAGKPGDVKPVWLSMESIVATIHAAGGLAVLAHPNKYQLTRTKLRALLSAFCDVGGDALEVISGRQTDQETRDLAGLARHYRLLASCGSDFHVPDQPWQELGAFGKLPDGCEPVWSAW